MNAPFDPPGSLQDLSFDGRRLWNDWIAEQIDAAIAGNPTENDGPRTQFFNEQKSPPHADRVERDIAWTAFTGSSDQLTSERQR
jgi:hypothetical protein